MLKKLVIFFFCFTAIFVIDQVVKLAVLDSLCQGNAIANGQIYLQDEPVEQCSVIIKGTYIDLVGVLNTGVAFSMFAAFADNLKFVHLGLLVALLLYLLWQRRFFAHHLVAFAFLFGAGCSNLIDRFVYGGVVDMFFWHKWFNFAIFNVADATINLCVLAIILKELFVRKKRKQSLENPQDLQDSFG